MDQELSSLLSIPSVRGIQRIQKALTNKQRSVVEALVFVQPENELRDLLIHYEACRAFGGVPLLAGYSLASVLPLLTNSKKTDSNEQLEEFYFAQIHSTKEALPDTPDGSELRATLVGLQVERAISLQLNTSQTIEEKEEELGEKQVALDAALVEIGQLLTQKRLSARTFQFCFQQLLRAAVEFPEKSAFVLQLLRPLYVERKPLLVQEELYWILLEQHFGQVDLPPSARDTALRHLEPHTQLHASLKAKFALLDATGKQELDFSGLQLNEESIRELVRFVLRIHQRKPSQQTQRTDLCACLDAIVKVNLEIAIDEVVSQVVAHTSACLIYLQNTTVEIKLPQLLKTLDLLRKKTSSLETFLRQYISTEKVTYVDVLLAWATPLYTVADQLRTILNREEIVASNHCVQRLLRFRLLCVERSLVDVDFETLDLIGLDGQILVLAELYQDGNIELFDVVAKNVITRLPGTVPGIQELSALLDTL